MIKIKYNYRDVYTPATSISNTLTAGTTGLNQSTLTITNKKYENIKDSIYNVTVTGTYNIVFTQCLFYRCTDIFSSILEFGSVTFNNCTFIECESIVNTDELITSTIEFNNCIIYNCLYVNTFLSVTLNECLYNTFYGVQTTIINTDSVIDNPLFLYLIDNSYDIGVLMSKSRGFMFDSPALIEVQTGWSSDAGCYIETRGTKSIVNDEIDIENICDSYKKNLYLPDFKKFINENGDIIQIWNYNKEQKYINISWVNNGLSESEIQSILTMQNMKNTQIYFYPDSTNASKYIIGQLNKIDNLDYSKSNNIFYENGNNGVSLVRFKSIILSILVKSEVGTWL